ncbi:MAG: acetolactate synthase small subunit, partial [Campylobacterales bacterium]|nr:acetolactate synthase small subunit [Campylobacterales bacterium]
IKVRASGVLRDEIFRLVDIFRAAIVDTTQSSYIIQIVGDSDKIQAFLNAVGCENVIETVRSGSLGIQRGEKCLCL